MIQKIYRRTQKNLEMKFFKNQLHAITDFTSANSLVFKSYLTQDFLKLQYSNIIYNIHTHAHTHTHTHTHTRESCMIISEQGED